MSGLKFLYSPFDFCRFFADLVAAVPRASYLYFTCLDSGDDFSSDYYKGFAEVRRVINAGTCLAVKLDDAGDRSVLHELLTSFDEAWIGVGAQSVLTPKAFSLVAPYDDASSSRFVGAEAWMNRNEVLFGIGDGCGSLAVIKDDCMSLNGRFEFSELTLA